MLDEFLDSAKKLQLSKPEADKILVSKPRVKIFCILRHVFVADHLMTYILANAHDILPPKQTWISSVLTFNFLVKFTINWLHII